jgi:hypothetical protein
MNMYPGDLPQRSFENVLLYMRHMINIRHFSFVKLTNSSDDTSREDDGPAPAQTFECFKQELQ